MFRAKVFGETGKYTVRSLRFSLLIYLPITVDRARLRDTIVIETSLQLSRFSDFVLFYPVTPCIRENSDCDGEMMVSLMARGIEKHKTRDR